MCIPAAVALAAASVIATVGKGVMDHQMKIKAARLNRQQSEMQAAAIREAANEARELDMEAADAQENEIERAASLQTFERTRQAQRDAAKTRVATSEAGVLGNTLSTQLANAALNSSFDIGIVEANMKSALGQVDRERLRTDATYKSRLNEAATISAAGRAGEDAVPGFGLTALGIGIDAAGAGLQGYNMGSSIDKSFNKKTNGLGLAYIPVT